MLVLKALGAMTFTLGGFAGRLSSSLVLPLFLASKTLSCF